MMDYYSGAPEPNDFDYNNGGQGSSGGNIFDFFRKNSFLVLIILAVIIVILIVIFLLTAGGESPNYETRDKDSSLSELYVSGGIIEPMFSPDVIDYTVIADYDYVTFTCKAKSDKAKVEGCDDGVLVDDKDTIEYDIKVTAEDGNITRYHMKIKKMSNYDE